MKYAEARPGDAPTARPPRKPFALAVGVTGHWLDTISAEALPHVEWH